MVFCVKMFFFFAILLNCVSYYYNRVDVRGPGVFKKKKHIYTQEHQPQRLLRKEIISSIVSDELTKPTRRLILLQMFKKQTLQNTTEKYVKKSFCSKMFERKIK